MRTTNWLIIALQVCAFAVCLTACSVIGVSEPTGASVAQVPGNPTTQADFTPLFAPQSNETIDPVNASSLAPSVAINYQGMRGVVWLPDGQGAALAGEQGVMLLSTTESSIGAQASTPEAIKAITSATPSLLNVAQEAAVLAWVSEGKAINVLDATVNLVEPIITQSESPVTGLALTPSGDQVAYATFSGQVVMQAPGNEQSAQSWTTPAWLANLSYSLDGDQLAGADLAGFILYFLDAKTGTVLRILEWSESVTPALSGVYLSPDWSQVAWVAQGAVQLMDANTGQSGPMLLHQNVVNAINWSPDSRLLATAAAVMVNDTFEPAVLVWDAKGGELLNILIQPVAVQSLVFSPDGQQLAVLNINGDLQTWSVSR